MICLLKFQTLDWQEIYIRMNTTRYQIYSYMYISNHVSIDFLVLFWTQFGSFSLLGTGVWDRTATTYSMDGTRKYNTWKIYSWDRCLVIWCITLGDFHIWKSSLLLKNQQPGRFSLLLYEKSKVWYCHKVTNALITGSNILGHRMRFSWPSFDATGRMYWCHKVTNAFMLGVLPKKSNFFRENSWNFVWG